MRNETRDLVIAFAGHGPVVEAWAQAAYKAGVRGLFLDDNPALAASLAQRFDGRRVTSVEELSSLSPDGVVIVAPDGDGHELALHALRIGAEAVVCGPPPTLALARAVAETAHEQQAEVFQPFVQPPMLAEAATRVVGGAIGRPERLAVRWERSVQDPLRALGQHALALAATFRPLTGRGEVRARMVGSVLEVELLEEDAPGIHLLLGGAPDVREAERVHVTLEGKRGRLETFVRTPATPASHPSLYRPRIVPQNGRSTYLGELPSAARIRPLQADAWLARLCNRVANRPPAKRLPAVLPVGAVAGSRIAGVLAAAGESLRAGPAPGPVPLA